MRPMNRSQAQNLVHDNFVMDIQKSLINLPMFWWDKDPNTISFHVIQPDRQAGRDLVIHWGPSVVFENGLSEVTRIYTKDSYKRLNMLANVEVKTTDTFSLLLDRTAKGTREAFENAKSFASADYGRYPFSIGIGAVIKNGALLCAIITLDGANYRMTPRPVIMGTYYSEEDLYGGLKYTMDTLSNYLDMGLSSSKHINTSLNSLERFHSTNPAHIDYNLLGSYEDLLPPEDSPSGPPPQAWPPSPPAVHNLEDSTPPSGPIFEQVENEPYHKIIRKALEDDRIKKHKRSVKFLNTMAPLLTTEYKEFKKGTLSDEIGLTIQIIERHLDRLNLIGVLEYEIMKDRNKKLGYKIKLNEGYL